jgi:hypothetical protein
LPAIAVKAATTKRLTVPTLRTEHDKEDRERDLLVQQFP